MPDRDYTPPRDLGYITYTYRRAATVTAVRGDQNQGFPRYRSVAFTVIVEFEHPDLIAPGGTAPAIVPGESYSNETVDDWLREYIADHDLNDVAGFPNSGAEIADRLLNALSMNADTVAAVTLTMSDSPNESWTARWSRS